MTARSNNGHLFTIIIRVIKYKVTVKHREKMITIYQPVMYKQEIWNLWMAAQFPDPS